MTDDRIAETAEELAQKVRCWRSVAHRAVTEGVNLKYVDLLRKACYAACDEADALLDRLDVAEKRLDAERHAADCTIYNAQPPWRCSCGLDAVTKQRDELRREWGAAAKVAGERITAAEADAKVARERIEALKEERDEWKARAEAAEAQK